MPAPKTKRAPPKEIEVVAPSLEEAVEAGAAAMGVDASNVAAEVLEEKSSFLRLGKAKVRVRLRLKPSDPGVDGRFHIAHRDGAFYLMVTPPEGAGMPVDPQAVEEALKGMPLPDGVEPVWKGAVAAASGHPIALAPTAPMALRPLPPQPKPAEKRPLADRMNAPSAASASEPAPGDSKADAHAQAEAVEELGPTAAVIVSPDGMKAWIVSTSLSFDEPVTEADARAAIAEAGLTYGVSDDLVNRIFGRPLPAPKQIAQGVEAVHSQDGRIEFHFKVKSDEKEKEKEKVPVADDKGSIDWFEQFAVETVDQGQVLVEAHPATTGVKGMTVRGMEIPATEGVPVDIQKLVGKNTDLIDNRIVAHMGGEPAIEGGKVVIHEVLNIQKNVDFSTGNVRFPGSISIKGDVKPGTRVQVKDNITIGGLVAGALVACSGDAVIARGFLGEAEGRTGALKVGGDLKVMFIEGGVAHVGGDLLVAQEIVRGDVGALGSLKVEGRGRIIGGRVSAGREIYARTIGSDTGARTVVSVGNEAAEARTVKALLEARALKEMLPEPVPGAAPPDAAGPGATAAEVPPAAEEKPAEGETPEHAGPRLVVADAIYPGTVISIGQAARIVDMKIDHCILREVDGEIQIFPL